MQQKFFSQSIDERKHNDAKPMQEEQSTNPSMQQTHSDIIHRKGRRGKRKNRKEQQRREKKNHSHFQGTR